MITESKHNEKIPLTSVPLARDWSYSEPFWNLTHSLKGSTELLPAIYANASIHPNLRHLCVDFQNLLHWQLKSLASLWVPE